MSKKRDGGRRWAGGNHRPGYAPKSRRSSGRSSRSLEVVGDDLEAVKAWVRREIETSKRREVIGKIAPLLEEILERLEGCDSHGSPDVLLKTAEVAHLEGVSQKTVTRRCVRGEYPGAHRSNGTSGHWRIPASAILARRAGVEAAKPKTAA